MFKNYLVLAWRNILRNRLNSIINIIGLSTGIAVSFIIFMHVIHEFSFDNYHKSADNIYRVTLKRIYPQNEINYAITPTSFGIYAQNKFPEINDMCRLLFPRGEFIVRYEDKAFKEKHVCFADSNFFELFNIPLIQGNPETILKDINSIIITESAAKKYFGKKEALGKIINTPNGDLKIEGICADVPENTHFKFDFLGPLKATGLLEAPNFISFSVYTYLKLHKGLNPKNLEKKFPDFVKKYASGQVENQLGVTYEEYIKAGNGYVYYLQPIKKIHLHSKLSSEIQSNSNILYIIIYISIAIIILIIACINYINLSTAKSTDRAKEVGIRKLVGSEKKLLIYQFLAESFCITLISVFIAVILTELITPMFNLITGSNFTINFLQDKNPALVLFLITIFTVFLAGSYPAFIMSSFKPIAVLQGRFISSKKGIWLRNTLVIAQFSISIALIISILHINKQVNYLLKKELGFNKENILIIERVNALGNQAESFRNKIVHYPGIINAGYSNTFISGGFYFGVFFQADLMQSEVITTRGMIVDDYFNETMQLQLVEGRNFSANFNDSLCIIINESAVKEFNIAHPVGSQIYSTALNNNPSSLFNIIGVVKDFHYNSLHNDIKSFVLFSNESIFQNTFFLNIKIAENRIKESIQFIEETWKEFLPDEPFTFIFFNDHINNLYKNEHNSILIFTILTILAILISSIGLFGLSAFIAGKRTKEIGIRKVMGASVIKIGSLLSKDIIKLIFYSFILASPIAYFIIIKWLDNFAYKTSIEIWIFIAGGLLALIIAVITISYHVIRTTNANPIDSLRYE